MRPALKPLARYPVVALLSCGFLFVAFLLLLLVALSLPIAKSIYLIRFISTAHVATPLSIATDLRFGVWGVCVTGNLNQPTWYTNPGVCFGPQLGYTVPEYIADTIGISRTVVKIVQQGLLSILILHPIAAIFATASLLSSLFLASHAFSIFTLILTIITALLSSVVLAIDVTLVNVADRQVDNLPDVHGDVRYGNGVWMILVAVVFVWAAVITLSGRACYCLGVRKHPDDKSLRIMKRRGTY